MKTTEFINKYSPCKDGREYAEKFETMEEVWNNCKRPDWLFWILEKHKPLEKEQSVRLAIAFAELALVNWKDENDKRPFEAIQAAKNWLENPCSAAESAAEAAAEAAARSAARSAAEAARSAARSAAEAAEAAAARSAAEAAEAAAARSAAESAAWAAAEVAWSAAWAAQCDLIRQYIPNPF